MANGNIIITQSNLDEKGFTSSLSVVVIIGFCVVLLKIFCLRVRMSLMALEEKEAVYMRELVNLQLNLKLKMVM